MPGIPTFWWHVAQVVMLACLLGLLVFGIVKPTTRTIYQEPVTQVHNFENPKAGFGGCQRLEVNK